MVDVMAFKKTERRVNLAILVVSTFLAAVGQLLFKFGLNNQSSPILFAVGIVIGILVYGMSTVAYMIALSRTHLSWAYGIGGFSYIFATLFAAFVLLENVPLMRWAGVFVIFIGVVIVGMS